MEHITSRENKWVKRYIKLSTSRHTRRETGEFVAEGVRLVAEAAAYGSLTAVFCTEDCMLRFPDQLASVLSRAQVSFLVSPSVAEKLADTRTSQGVFAIVKRPNDRLTAAQLQRGGRYAILCQLQDPGNLGTIFRTAEALGLDGILVDEACCDPLSPKAVRGSMGAVFRMPFGTASLRQMLLHCADAGIPTFASVLADDAIKLIECSFEKGGVLLIGNEGNGLPDWVVDAVSYRVTIPMAGEAESLNAAIAAGILIWEMCKEGVVQ